MNNGPQGKRRGRLLHGNPPCDLTALPRCGAKTRSGDPCGQHAMRNGRCRFHGGLSTGPRTLEGRERSRMANFKSGRYTLAARQERARFRAVLCEMRRLIALGAET